MKPTFFPTPAKFRAWLQKNHRTKTELLVGFYKVDSGKPSITWSQSVDEALCFGWIDGVRRSIDDKSYSIRFTPRKPNSIWSAVNIKKIGELTKKGLMHKDGLDIFEKRTEGRSKIYGHETQDLKLSPAFEKKLKADKKAWAYFQSLAPGYKKLSINWVMSAKQEVTKAKRMDQLIAESRKGTNQWKHNKYKN